MEVIRARSEQVLLQPLETFRQHQQEVSEELNALARGHAEASGGMLTVLDIDPDNQPAQKVTKPYVDSVPSPVEEITGIATLAEDRFPNMLGKLVDMEEDSQEISRIAEDLRAGENIIVVTNHGKIQDIALTLASYHVALREVLGDPEEGPDFNTSIILSKMISHLGFYGEPAVDILGKMCDRQYFSFPKTKSIRNSRISNRLVTTYNQALRGVINHQLGSDQGSLLAMAASGTTDKLISPAAPNTRLMSTVGEGTVKILTSPNTKVLPVAVWLDDEMVFEPLGFPRKLQDADDVHAMMGDIAGALNMSAPNIQHIYQQWLDDTY